MRVAGVGRDQAMHLLPVGFNSLLGVLCLQMLKQCRVHLLKFKKILNLFSIPTVCNEIRKMLNI